MERETVADAYQKASLENAPPIKIVRMLYHGAIRFLDRAMKEDPQDPESHFVELVHKADCIVSELRMALDHEPEPEVSRNLESLYFFVETELGKASFERRIELLESAKGVLTTLSEAWGAVEINSTRVA